VRIVVLFKVIWTPLEGILAQEIAAEGILCFEPDDYFASAFATHGGANEWRYRQNRNTQQIGASTAPHPLQLRHG
jgi:hypothetical protein